MTLGDWLSKLSGLFRSTRQQRADREGATSSSSRSPTRTTAHGLDPGVGPGRCVGAGVSRTGAGRLPQVARDDRVHVPLRECGDGDEGVDAHIARDEGSVHHVQARVLVKAPVVVGGLAEQAAAQGVEVKSSPQVLYTPNRSVR